MWIQNALTKSITMGCFWCSEIAVVKRVMACTYDPSKAAEAPRNAESHFWELMNEIKAEAVPMRITESLKFQYHQTLAVFPAFS